MSKVLLKSEQTTSTALALALEPLTVGRVRCLKQSQRWLLLVICLFLVPERGLPEGLLQTFPGSQDQASRSGVPEKCHCVNCNR